MKALVYETANTIENFAIQLREIPEPTLRDGDVLVEVRAIGINPGEAFFRQVRSAEPGGYVLLGWEFAGVVAEVGRSVQAFKAGDRVFGTGDVARNGSYAERLAVDHRIIAKLPDAIPFDQAASLPVGAITASEAMFRDQDALPPGVKTVLVIGGAGAIGSLATQLLKATTSAFVIATGSRLDSREWCCKMGADLVVDHSGDVPVQLAAANVREIDMVLSTAATAQNLGWIANVLRPYGHIAFTDVATPDISPFGPLGAKAPSLHMEMMFSRIVNDSQPERQGQFLENLAALVTEGDLRPILTKRLDGLTAESMRAAHELIETQRTIGKIVIAL
jgi:zinc-binding alcohol dehydrogenase family protein